MKTDKKRSYRPLAVVVWGACFASGWFFPTTTHAQISARSLGMGSGATALARGVDAALYNPANLGLRNNPRFSMTFFSLGAGLHNNSFTKTDYDRYLVDDPVWDQNDIETILHRIPEDGLHVHGRATSRVLSFSIGRFALSMGSEAGSWAQADKDLFSLALQGNQVGRTYLLQQTDGEASAIGLIGLSYGHPLRVTFADAFAVGATLQMVYGIRQARIVDAQASFLTQPHGFAVNGEYEAALDVGKPGVNLDAGVAAQFGSHWTISAALLNLIGHTVWTTEESSFGYVRGDSLTAYKAADLEEEAIEDSSWTVENGDNFQQKLPARLRIGGAYETDKVAVTLDYIQGFSRTAWHGTHPQFSLGAEWKIARWLPLRVGLALGGDIGAGTSCGLGIRPGGFILDLAVMNSGVIVPGKARGLLLAFELAMILR